MSFSHANPGSGDAVRVEPRGPRLLWLAAVVNVVVWIVFAPGGDVWPNHVRQVIAETAATTAVVLMAGALLLSTRARWLEPHFGGLDKVYRTHRRAAVAGFLLLVSHVALIPWRLDSAGGVPAGLIAFFGITVLVILSVGPRLALTRHAVTLNYRTWRRTHWLIGLFFIFSLAHMLLVDSLVTTAPIQFVLVMTAYVVGVLSFLYVVFLARLVRPTRKYVVTSAHRLNDNTLEMLLTPKTRPIEHRSGQFVFVRFKGRKMREPHPFTVASGPKESTLRLAVKASGDFTRQLHEELEPGRRARVEGAYGMLDYRRGRRRQIWIAGGIGITPFLSWLDDIDEFDHDVDLIYTVRQPDDALYIEDISEVADRHPQLRFCLWVSAESGSLTIGQILELAGDPHPSELSVYMCGPVGMVQAFESGLVTRGVHPSDIHYEEFSFR